MKEKLLITGGNGYLGRHLVEYMSIKGHDVVALVRNKARALECFKHNEIIVRELSDGIIRILEEEQPDVIIHCATSYGRKGESLVDLIYPNIEMGLELLVNHKKTSGKVFVNIGTSLPSSVSSYASTKSAFLRLAHDYLSDDNNYQFINIKCEHFYGPNEGAGKFVGYVIGEFDKGSKELLLTKGEQLRDFIYIDDLLEALNCILEKRKQLNNVDELSVGSGVAISIESLVRLIQSMMSAKTKLLFGRIPYRENEVMEAVADKSKLTKLGWTVNISLVEGLKKIILNKNN